MCDDRNVYSDDVIVRRSAIENINKIAGKVTDLRTAIYMQMDRSASEMMDSDGAINMEKYHDEMSTLLDAFAKKVDSLVHGIATTLSIGRGGSVVGEDDYALGASGRVLSCGLIYHSDIGEWRVHS